MTRHKGYLSGRWSTECNTRERAWRPPHIRSYQLFQSEFYGHLNTIRNNFIITILKIVLTFSNMIWKSLYLELVQAVYNRITKWKYHSYKYVGGCGITWRKQHEACKVTSHPKRKRKRDLRRGVGAKTRAFRGKTLLDLGIHLCLCGYWQFSKLGIINSMWSGSGWVMINFVQSFHMFYKPLLKNITQNETEQSPMKVSVFYTFWKKKIEHCF